MLRIAKLAALAAVALVACDGGGGTKTTPTPTAASRPATTGTIEIIAPTAGQTVEGPDVPVEVSLEGAELIPEVTTEIEPGEGHLHLKLDGETITLLGSLDETIPDVAPGSHLLEVEFVAGDHGPFNPRVVRTVTFTVT